MVPVISPIRTQPVFTAANKLLAKPTSLPGIAFGASAKPTDTYAVSQGVSRRSFVGTAIKAGLAAGLMSFLSPHTASAVKPPLAPLVQNEDVVSSPSEMYFFIYQGNQNTSTPVPNSVTEGYTFSTAQLGHAVQWMINNPDKSTYPEQTRQMLVSLYALASVQTNPIFQNDPLFKAWQDQGAPVGTIPVSALMNTTDNNGLQHTYPDGGIAIRAYDLQELAYKYLSQVPVSHDQFMSALQAVVPNKAAVAITDGAGNVTGFRNELLYPTTLEKAGNKVLKKAKFFANDNGQTSIVDKDGNDTGVNFAQFVLLCDIGRNIGNQNQVAGQPQMPVSYHQIKAAFDSLGAGASVQNSQLSSYAPNPDGTIF